MPSDVCRMVAHREVGKGGWKGWVERVGGKGGGKGGEGEVGVGREGVGVKFLKVVAMGKQCRSS